MGGELRQNKIPPEAILRCATRDLKKPMLSKPVLEVARRRILRAERAERLFDRVERRSWWRRLGSLDRKDYATAQGLFEASAERRRCRAGEGIGAGQSGVPQARSMAGGPMASDSRNKARQKPVTSPLEVIPLADAAYRRPLPQAEKAKSRRLKPLLLGTGLVLFAIFSVSAIYVRHRTGRSRPRKARRSPVFLQLLMSSRRIWRRSRAKARARRSGPRYATSAALTQLTVRLDQIEHEYGARLDKLSERVDQDSSSRFADIAARLDKLEKKTALPATPASESADVVARLDKLEKESPSRLRRPQKLLVSRQGSTSWRRELPSRAQVRPIPSRLPRRNNRRLWQGRNLPPRMKQPDPTTRGPCSETIASRMYGTASRWLTVAMVRKR